MARTTGTATEHVLATLRQWPDNEMTLADIYDLAGGTFSKENLRQSLDRLAASGKISRSVEGRSVWWAISAAGPVQAAGAGVVEQPEVERAALREPTPVKAIVKRPTMVIPRGRY